MSQEVGPSPNRVPDASGLGTRIILPSDGLLVRATDRHRCSAVLCTSWAAAWKERCRWNGLTVRPVLFLSDQQKLCKCPSPYGYLPRHRQ